jgi:hypothetical protein
MYWLVASCLGNVLTKVLTSEHTYDILNNCIICGTSLHFIARQRHNLHRLRSDAGSVVLLACFLIFEPFFFFSGEGPRSRRYGRTAAMRLIVQPYDEDEDDDYFLSFS